MKKLSIEPKKCSADVAKIQEHRLMRQVARLSAAEDGCDDAGLYRRPSITTLRTRLARFRAQVVALEGALADPFAPGAARVLELSQNAWEWTSSSNTALFDMLWNVGYSLRAGCMDDERIARIYARACANRRRREAARSDELVRAEGAR